MKNIPLPDLYYLENPDLKQLFLKSATIIQNTIKGRFMNR